MKDLRIARPEHIRAALDAAMASGGLLLDESQLTAEFFDLTSGLAGELIRKFTSYRAKLAIVVADASAHGSRFSELAYEHRAHNCVRVFASERDARRWLAYNPVTKC